ncbi:isopeptide-forming domain-containing fimbrial protein [Candidatus Latescibacterota bacterium]
MRAHIMSGGWWFLLVLLLLVSQSTAWAAGTPAGTVISNYATVSYKDGNGNTLPPINSNTVTTIVAQVAGVDISPATEASNILAGGSIPYHFHVTNIGNGPDTIDLTDTGLPAGWTSVIYQDLNDNGILDASEQVAGNILTSVSLAADEAIPIFIEITAPSGASDGGTAVDTLTATSQFDNTVSDTGTYTSTVSVAVLSVLKFATPLDPLPGDVVTYEIRGSNDGTSTAYNVKITDVIPSGMSYVTESIRFAMGAGGSYDTATPATDAVDTDFADFGNTAANTLTVNWGDSPGGQVGSLFFRATVSDGIVAGTNIENIAYIDYENPEGTPITQGNSSPADIVVAPLPDPIMIVETIAHTGQPGDSLYYEISITNGGNTSDVFDITTSTTGGFPNEIWVDSNNDGIPGNSGDYLLTDTDGDGIVDTGIMLPGETQDLVLLLVNIPQGTSDDTVDVTTITITSSVDTGISTSGTVTTTVYAPVVSTVKSVNPAGGQPPGQVLEYTLVVTNTGQGNAIDVIVTDQVPTNTAYVANSITVDGNSRTDAIDGDNAGVSINEVIVDIGTMGPGSSHTIVFKVSIN